MKARSLFHAAVFQTVSGLGLGVVMVGMAIRGAARAVARSVDWAFLRIIAPTEKLSAWAYPELKHPPRKSRICAR